MKSLSTAGAHHFVASFASCPTTKQVDLAEFIEQRFARAATVTEGTSAFEEVRDCLLREAERSLLLSAGCYLRSLESLRPAASYWTLVGLYYSCFFSAKAVMGMLGCWIKSPKNWIEVQSSNPGNQSLTYRKSNYPSGRGGGPHQQTWHAYYSAVRPLQTWVDPTMAVAVTPVSAQETWLIDLRNEFNYKPVAAMRLKHDFDNIGTVSRLPAGFPGRFGTLFGVTRALLRFAAHTADSFGLRTDVCQPEKSRRDWIARHVISSQDPAFRQFADSEASWLV